MEVATVAMATTCLQKSPAALRRSPDPWSTVNDRVVIGLLGNQACRGSLNDTHAFHESLVFFLR